MNHHNTDNAGAEFWADCTWKGGMTSLGGDYTYNHIYSTNLGEPLPTPHGKYTHAKDRHVGNLWLRHVKQWERFDVSGSAGVSFTPYGTSALWSLSGGYRPVRGLRLEVGAAQSMRLPTFTDLYYTSPAQLNNLDLKPEHAITYRFAADYARSGWNASLFTYYRQGRDIIDWVWREELGKWHSEQAPDFGFIRLYPYEQSRSGHHFQCAGLYEAQSGGDGRIPFSAQLFAHADRCGI